MATGLTYTEIFDPDGANNTVTCSYGKYTATRYFLVDSNSPSAAIRTIRDDASLDFGAAYSEPCSNYIGAGGKLSASDDPTKMRVSNIIATPQSNNKCYVEVQFDDDNNIKLYDENRYGCIDAGFEFATTQETVEQGTGDNVYWDGDAATGQKEANPNNASYYLRNLGWDGEQTQGVPKEVANGIWTETWHLPDTSILDDPDPGAGDSSTWTQGILEGISPTDYRIVAEDAVKARLAGGSTPSGTYPYYMYLHACIGLVNSVAFRDFPAKTLLMLAPTLELIGYNSWNITYRFAYSPAWYQYLIHDQDEGRIIFSNGSLLAQAASLKKEGWEYLWYQYASTASRRYLNRVYVGEVYNGFDFERLGLGLSPITTTEDLTTQILGSDPRGA